MSVAETIVIKQNPITEYERFNKTFINARGDISDYQDDNRAMGGFWTASFTTSMTMNKMLDLFENGLGREFIAYGYGSQILHEGMVYELVLNLPPDKLTISLESMYNTILMRSDYDGDDAVERSTELTNANSVARYGTKARVYGGGQLTSLAVADQAVQTALNQIAFPTPSIERGSGSGNPSIEIFSRGYIYTLGWELYNYTSGGTQGASAQIEDIVDDAQYVASYSYDGNATTVNKDTDADRKILNLVEDIAKLGDQNNTRWLLYMTEGRVLNFKESAPSEVIG